MSATSAAGGGGGNNGYTGPGKGLVLVFDLDQTIIDSHGIMDLVTARVDQDVKDKTINQALNHRLVEEILRPAARLRASGSDKIDAILLLTNNSSRDYVSEVCTYLSKYLKSKGAFEDVRATVGTGDPAFPTAGTGLFFDYIMVRQHFFRPKSENPPKRMRDVELMLKALGYPPNDLERRTFFFDDMLPKHVIERELAAKGYANHYIVIKGCVGDGSGGFIGGTADCSDYTPVTEAFKHGVAYSQPVPTLTAASTPAAEVVELTEEQKREQANANAREAEEEARARAFVAAAKATKSRSALTGLFAPPPAAAAAAMNAANLRAAAYEGGRRRYKKTRRRNKKAKANKKSRRRY
jgi:hypothetical protein